MRRWGTIGVLILCLALASSIACSPFGSAEEEVSQQLVEVVRGDLVISVRGGGNIEVSKKANLAFAVGGRIDKIYVDGGNSVTEGDVLAKLETAALELALTQAKVALTTQQLAVTQTQVALDTAEYKLNQALEIYTWPEIVVAQADVDAAKAFLEYVLEKGLSGATLSYAQARLDAAEATLDAMVYDYDTEEVDIYRMEVGLAEQSLELAKQSLEQARQSLKYAEKQLKEATISAPFDGVVAKIYAEEGDVIPPPIMTSQGIIHLIDLTTMELNVEVDEIDIPEVKLGQRAIIDVDALPDVNLEGEVTSISPLPKEGTWLVLYEVKINFAVPEGSGLRVGMSATADIVIDERSNVLLVPDRAIKQDTQGNPVVEVMVGGQIEERTVVIGVSDSLQTEIVDGLKEGDMVVVKTKVKATKGFLVL